MPPIGGRKGISMAEAVKHASDADLDAFKKDQTVKTVDASKKVRIGFIGTGGIANSHIKAYLNQPDVEIVAGCDLVPGRAKAFFEKYDLTDVKTDYKDHTEMLADLIFGVSHHVCNCGFDIR